jgi:polyhydroxyalkanoate synthesis repressor PhaR
MIILLKHSPYNKEQITEMDRQRIIKKYPNRRLYDTQESCYITLSDIKELVSNYIEFTVIDSQAGNDITNTILLQIINELEHSSTPIFTTEVLKNIIRFYDSAMQGIMSQYLEKSMALFTAQNTTLQKQIKNYKRMGPVQIFNELVQHNLSTLQSSFEELLASIEQRKGKVTEKPQQ